MIDPELIVPIEKVSYAYSMVRFRLTEALGEITSSRAFYELIGEIDIEDLKALEKALRLVETEVELMGIDVSQRVRQMETEALSTTTVEEAYAGLGGIEDGE